MTQRFMEDYCVCGGAIKVASHNEQETELAEFLVAQWQKAHVGDGRRSCQAATANAARNGWRTRPSTAARHR